MAEPRRLADEQRGDALGGPVAEADGIVADLHVLRRAEEERADQLATRLRDVHQLLDRRRDDLADRRAGPAPLVGERVEASLYLEKESLLESSQQLALVAEAGVEAADRRTRPAHDRGDRQPAEALLDDQRLRGVE